MARFPDGWVFIPKVRGPKLEDGKLVETVSVDERELVMCKHCEFYGKEPIGTLRECYRGCGWTEPIDYCSRGKRSDEDEADRR